MQTYFRWILRFIVVGLCGCLLACGKADQQVLVQCQPPTGNAFEEGQVEACAYQTDSIDTAYQMIVKQHQHDTSGYQLLRKSLPEKPAKDSFDAQSVWISYSRVAADSATVKLQMAGGEDELVFKKQNGKVIVQTTFSAD